jgi:hypothetical protein
MTRQTHADITLVQAAMDVLDDFEAYGPVLQSDEHGDYGPATAIAKLRDAVDAWQEYASHKTAERSRP